MANVRPNEAIVYALSREMATLYGVVLVGYVLLTAAGWFGTTWAFRGGGAGFVGQLLSAGFFLAGFVVVLAGSVGLVYKVIADATAARA